MGGYRWVENMMVLSRGKTCRRPGFERLFAETTPYNNQDLHDQLTFSDRQPITLLFEAVSTTGVHRLIAGTQNRLYALNTGTGTWLTISDEGFGGLPLTSCSDTFWTAAQIEDTLVFTNGIDKPKYWTFDAPPGLNDITDLHTLNITKANVVASWKGVMFYANVVADGVRVPHRLVWSDFRKPLSLIPSANVSIAGSHDLGYGEDILAILPLADSLLIYTLHGIWEAQPTGDDSVFSFRQRYAEPLTGNGCLAYKRTIISTGDEHLYMGRDGIYVYNLYTPKPNRVDWIYRASATIFDELETSLCGLHVAGWNPLTKEAWFSWAKMGNNNRCPYSSLVVNTQYQFCDYVRRGFSAFVNYSPSSTGNLRDWILEQCICTEAELEVSGVDQGAAFCVTPVSTANCGSDATSIYSTGSMTYFGITTENFDASNPDANSLCAILGSLTLDQLCSEEQQTQACSAAQRFVMASTDDFTVKQYGTIYAHEICTSFAVCGSYTQYGYDSILRSGPIDFKAPNAMKLIKRMLLNCEADFQTVPNNVIARLGFARQPSDPNLTNCPIMWRILPAKQLACASPKVEADHIAAGTRPNLAIQWPTFWGEHFIFWELKVSGTGGPSCFSSINFDVAARPVRI